MSDEESPYLRRLKELLSRKPDSRLFLSLAEELWRRGVTDVAIGIVEEGLKRHPDFTAARCSLGWWYLLKDRPLDAETQLLEVVEKEPRSLTGHRLLARILSRLGKTGQAVTEYRKVIGIRPFDPDALRALGELDRMRGDERSAGPPAETHPLCPTAPGAAADVAPLAGHFAEAEKMLARGLHAGALDLYTSALSSDPAVWRAVQRREEAQALLREEQLVRKRAAVERMNRLRTAVKDRFGERPSQDQPPVHG